MRGPLPPPPCTRRPTRRTCAVLTSTNSYFRATLSGHQQRRMGLGAGSGQAPDTDSGPSGWGIPGPHIPGIRPRKTGPGGHEPIAPEIPHPVRRAGDQPNSAGNPRSEPFSPRSKAGTTQPMVQPAIGSTTHQTSHEKTHRSLIQGNSPKDCGPVLNETLSQIHRFGGEVGTCLLPLFFP